MGPRAIVVLDHHKAVSREIVGIVQDDADGRSLGERHVNFAGDFPVGGDGPVNTGGKLESIFVGLAVLHRGQAVAAGNRFGDDVGARINRILGGIGNNIVQQHVHIHRLRVAQAGIIAFEIDLHIAGGLPLGRHDDVAARDLAHLFIESGIQRITGITRGDVVTIELASGIRGHIGGDSAARGLDGAAGRQAALRQRP